MSDVSPPDQPQLVLCLLLLIPLGLGTKIYTGPGASWVQGHAGGVLYVMFWITATVWAVPSLSPWTAAGAVLIVTCGLEFLQLWRPSPLHAVRETLVGRILLGSTFDWWDFPHYFLGAGLGGLLIQALTGSDSH